MTLKTVLCVKIFCTLCFWSVPLLLIPERWLTSLDVPAESRVFVRLLGGAYAALLVGYIIGLRDLRRHGTITETVRNAVRVGIVSNGLACLILVLTGATGGWSELNPWIHIGLWFSAFLTGGITLGLIWKGLYEHP